MNVLGDPSNYCSRKIEKFENKSKLDRREINGCHKFATPFRLRGSVFLFHAIAFRGTTCKCRIRITRTETVIPCHKGLKSSFFFEYVSYICLSATTTLMWIISHDNTYRLPILCATSKGLNFNIPAYRAFHFDSSIL